MGPLSQENQSRRRLADVSGSLSDTSVTRQRGFWIGYATTRLAMEEPEMPKIQSFELAKRGVLIAFLLLALPCCALGSPGPAAPARPEYTQQMYTKALSNYSTGPSYLLVTVRTSAAAPGRV